MNASTRIAFLGGGNMAWALIQGLLRHGVAASQLAVGEPIETQRSRIQAELGVAALAENSAAVRDATLVVVAVKPQQALGVLHELRGALAASRPLLLSIIAGTRIADLIRACPGLPVVRAMPNRPALVGAGVTALYAGTDVDGAGRVLAEQVCAAVGRTVWVRRETDLDIVTALSGSGPAYFFLLAEHLAAAGAAQGLDPATAEMLAMHALRGAGAMLEGTANVRAQREAVTSQGGTTAAALGALAAGGFDKMVATAIAAATHRGAELGTLSGRATPEVTEQTVKE
jgi:pyrroline-5-carboxylate reductase